MFEISLKGKTALVTGGARGIGAQICKQMAKAGARIIVNYYNCDADREALKTLVPLLEENGVEVLTCMADVANEDEVNAMMKEAEKFGGVDVLVHNAGITPVAKIEEMSTEVWRRAMGVILDGAFFLTRGALPHMLEQGKGNFIMVTTNCTVNGGGGSAAYPAAKCGVEGLVKQLAYEYAGKGIRANVIRPAVIDTDLLRQRYPSDEEIAEYGKRLPVGHVGTAEDIANVAVFLASDISEYICGESILVDGGRTYYKK